MCKHMNSTVKFRTKKQRKRKRVVKLLRSRPGMVITIDAMEQKSRFLFG